MEQASKKLNGEGDNNLEIEAIDNYLGDKIWGMPFREKAARDLMFLNEIGYVGQMEEDYRFRQELNRYNPSKLERFFDKHSNNPFLFPVKLLYIILTVD